MAGVRLKVRRSPGLKIPQSFTYCIPRQQSSDLALPLYQDQIPRPDALLQYEHVLMIFKFLTMLHLRTTLS